MNDDKRRRVVSQELGTIPRRAPKEDKTQSKKIRKLLRKYAGKRLYRALEPLLSPVGTIDSQTLLLAEYISLSGDAVGLTSVYFALSSPKGLDCKWYPKESKQLSPRREGVQGRKSFIRLLRLLREDWAESFE